METERLKFRELTAADAQFAYELNSDPEVLKYTGDEAFESAEEAANFLDKYDHYKKYGFGRWGVVLKETGELIGWCGLKYTESLDEFDVGYRFFRKHWGKGYATEAAKFCLELGFEKFNMPAIVGRVTRANTQSIRVLEKIGLKFHENREGDCDLIYRKISTKMDTKK